MHIISIDPGRTTGYCYAIYEPAERRVYYYSFQIVDEVDDMWRRLELFKPRYIIIENFEFRQRVRTGLDLFPVQLIGVANLYSLLAPNGDCAVYMQTAAQGKGYYTDNLLKQQNLYIRGLPHAMDASRHLLQWLTFNTGHQLVSGTRDFVKLLTDDQFKAKLAQS